MRTIYGSATTVCIPFPALREQGPACRTQYLIRRVTPSAAAWKQQIADLCPHRMPPLVYARPVHNASLSSWSIESRKQCIQQLYRILRILNTNTDRTGLNRGIVITRRRHAITHEHHFIGRMPSVCVSLRTA